MNLTPAEARDVIQDAFNAGWGIPSPITPIAYDNLEFDPTKIDTPWVRLNIQFTTGSIQTLGSPGERQFRNFGLVFVQAKISKLELLSKERQEELTEEGVQPLLGDELF